MENKKTDDLFNMILSSSWLAGDNPLDRENPWEFRYDGTFTTLKDDHGGKWHIDSSNILKLKWTTVDGYADFKVTEFTGKSLKYKCIKSGWGFMKSWKIFSAKDD